jgi:hypothetical protein
LPQDERAQVPISTALRGRPLNFWERWQASPHAGSAQMAASLTGSAAVISLHFARQGISAPFANFAALAGSVATAGTSYKVFHWLQASPALRTLHEADESLPLRCLGGLLQEWAGRKGTAPAPGTPSLQSLLERQALELLPIFQRAVDGDEGKAWEAVVTLAERQDLSGALRHAGVLSAQDGRDVHYKEWLMSVGHHLGNASSLLDAVSDTLPRAQRERLDACADDLRRRLQPWRQKKVSEDFALWCRASALCRDDAAGDLPVRDGRAIAEHVLNQAGLDAVGLAGLLDAVPLVLGAAEVEQMALRDLAARHSKACALPGTIHCDPMWLARLGERDPESAVRAACRLAESEYVGGQCGLPATLSWRLPVERLWGNVEQAQGEGPRGERARELLVLSH